MTFIDDNGNTIEYRGQFSLTKQAVSFFNGSIKGDVSITFTVDNNSQNRKTLGYYGAMTLNNIAFVKQQFNRIRMGVILDRGYIVIQEADNDSIKCFYITGNANWFQKLQGLITEFNYNDYAVTWTGATISSRSSATSGVVFPIADYWANGRKGSSDFVLYMPNDWQTDSPNIFPEIYPAFFLKDLVTEFLVQADNIKLEGNILDDVLYKSLTIGSYSPVIKRTKTVNDVIIGAGTNQSFTAGVAAKYVNYGTETTDIDGLFSGGTYTASKKTGVYVSFTVSLVPTTTNYPMIYKNGSLFYSFNYTGIGLNPSIIIAVNPGDTLEIWVLRSTSTTYRISSLTISENEWVWPSDWANPKDFLPPLACIDVIKFIVNYFGCTAYFDEISRVLSINIIEKLKKEDALNLSANYLGHTESYGEASKNNYFRWLQGTTDTAINKYNNQYDVDFAEGNIETSSNIRDKKDIATHPFNVFKSDINRKGMVLANIPLITLQDGNQVTYDTASVSTGYNSLVTVADELSETNRFNEYIRIVNDNEDRGYFFSAYRNYSSASTLTTFRAITQVDELFTDGNIVLQSYSANQLFVLLSVVNKNVSDFSSFTSITLYDETKNSKLKSQVPDIAKSVTLTSVPYAVFTKRMFSKPIDQLKNNLAIDNPELSMYNDPTIKELYFNKIKRFFNNPKIPATFVISEAVFNSFKFDRFIYLKTERLTGYFFIESFGNYVDSNTPVVVNLYML